MEPFSYLHQYQPQKNSSLVRALDTLSYPVRAIAGGKTINLSEDKSSEASTVIKIAMVFGAVASLYLSPRYIGIALGVSLASLGIKVVIFHKTEEGKRILALYDAANTYKTSEAEEAISLYIRYPELANWFEVKFAELPLKRLSPALSLMPEDKAIDLTNQKIAEMIGKIEEHDEIIKVLKAVFSKNRKTASKALLEGALALREDDDPDFLYQKLIFVEELIKRFKVPAELYIEYFEKAGCTRMEVVHIQENGVTKTVNRNPTTPYEKICTHRYKGHPFIERIMAKLDPELNIQTEGEFFHYISQSNRLLKLRSEDICTVLNLMETCGSPILASTVSRYVKALPLEAITKSRVRFFLALIFSLDQSQTLKVLSLIESNDIIHCRNDVGETLTQYWTRRGSHEVIQALYRIDPRILEELDFNVDFFYNCRLQLGRFLAEKIDKNAVPEWLYQALTDSPSETLNLDEEDQQKLYAIAFAHSSHRFVAKLEEWGLKRPIPVQIPKDNYERFTFARYYFAKTGRNPSPAQIRDVRQDLPLPPTVYFDGKEEVIQRFLGAGGTKRAFKISGGKALLYSAIPRIVDEEVAWSNFLEKVGLMGLRQEKAIVCFEKTAGAETTPVLITDSFEGLANQNIFVIDRKNPESTTWKSNIFTSREELYNANNWEPILAKFLEDVSTIVRYGLPTGGDSFNLALVQTDQGMQLRYFGFDFTSKLSKSSPPSEEKKGPLSRAEIRRALYNGIESVLHEEYGESALPPKKGYEFAEKLADYYSQLINI